MAIDAHHVITLTPKGLVIARQTQQRYQHNGQCRVDNALAGSADPVNPDGITTVTFEEYIDIHIAAVQAADDIEDTALCGNHSRTTVVLGQNGSQLFGGHIVHEESERLKHTGSRPMNITWKLDHPIPAKYLKKTQKLVVG